MLQLPLSMFKALAMPPLGEDATLEAAEKTATEAEEKAASEGGIADRGGVPAREELALAAEQTLKAALEDGDTGREELTEAAEEAGSEDSTATDGVGEPALLRRQASRAPPRGGLLPPLLLL